MTASAPAHSETADHLFTQALVLPPEAREAFVRNGSANDSGLFAQVLNMLRDFERLSGFLERPVEIAAAKPAFTPGTILAERFRIIERVGRGGMGEVYSADEILLGERVAIKVILADLAKEPWLIARFREEIRLGRRVSHRNVCRVHDVYEHTFASGQTTLFFSMELLEGSTLAETMKRRGPLPVAEALPLVKQMAEGLGAAHAAGIVHRDFKPGNIIVTHDGRAVITDFGLAQIEPKSAFPLLSTGEGIAGSLPYMAPEQFTGKPVTASADLFALGVVMYELITGRLPFPSQSISQGLAARLNEEWEPAPKWQAEIKWCLQPQPEKRPASVSALMQQLRGQNLTRRNVLIASAAAAVAASYVGYRAFVTAAVPPGVSALLPPPVSLVSEIRSGLVDQLLHAQLAQSAHFELLTAERIRAALARMGRNDSDLSSDRTLRREVALREGAPLVITAELSRPRDLVLTIEIEKLGSHPYFALVTSTRRFAAADEHELMTAVTQAVHWIRQTVGESASDLARRERRPEEITTASWDALLEYSQAEEARAAGQDENAIRHLRRALDLDASFPLANMRLADILLGQGSIDEAYGFWQRASDLVRKRNLTDRESYRIRGLFLHDVDDETGAAKVLEDWAADYPHDYLPLFYLANAQSRQGRYVAALKTAEDAAGRTRDNPHVILLGAQLYMEQGDLGKARRNLDSVREVNPWWWLYEAEHRFLSADYVGTWRCYQRMKQMPQPWPSRSDSLEACLFCECGDVARGMRVLQDGLTADLEQPRLSPWRRDKLLLLSAVALRVGDQGQAIERAREVAQLGEPSASLKAAALLADAGRPDDAEEILQNTETAADLPFYRALRLDAQAHAALARRQCTQAASLFLEKRHWSWAQAPDEGLARALDCAGRTADAGVIWTGLVQYPGRYWLEPERYRPGIYRDALERVMTSEARSRLQSLNAARGSLA